MDIVIQMVRWKREEWNNKSLTLTPCSCYRHLIFAFRKRFHPTSSFQSQQFKRANCVCGRLVCLKIFDHFYYRLWAFLFLLVISSSGELLQTTRSPWAVIKLMFSFTIICKFESAPEISSNWPAFDLVNFLNKQVLWFEQHKHWKMIAISIGSG